MCFALPSVFMGPDEPGFNEAWESGKFGGAVNQCVTVCYGRRRRLIFFGGIFDAVFGFGSVDCEAGEIINVAFSFELMNRSEKDNDIFPNHPT